MGLRWSAEKILSWRSQYARTRRWADRLQGFKQHDSFQDRLDFYLAFFQNCYALRDWLIKSNAISQSELERLIQTNNAMRLCRDICNRSKHFTIGNPSTEADFSILREYSPYGNRLIVLYLGEKRELFDIVTECLKFWDDLLKSHKPIEPENPFS